MALPVVHGAQGFDHALLVHQLEQFLVLLVGAIADVDALRLAQPGAVLDEAAHLRPQREKPKSMNYKPSATSI